MSLFDFIEAERVLVVDALRNEFPTIEFVDTYIDNGFITKTKSRGFVHVTVPSIENTLLSCRSVSPATVFTNVRLSLCLNREPQIRPYHEIVDFLYNGLWYTDVVSGELTIKGNNATGIIRASKPAIISLGD